MRNASGLAHVEALSCLASLAMDCVSDCSDIKGSALIKALSTVHCAPSIERERKDDTKTRKARKATELLTVRGKEAEEPAGPASNSRDDFAHRQLRRLPVSAFLCLNLRQWWRFTWLRKRRARHSFNICDEWNLMKEK